MTAIQNKNIYSDPTALSDYIILAPGAIAKWYYKSMEEVKNRLESEIDKDTAADVFKYASIGAVANLFINGCINAMDSKRLCAILGMAEGIEDVDERLGTFACVYSKLEEAVDFFLKQDDYVENKRFLLTRQLPNKRLRKMFICMDNKEAKHFLAGMYKARILGLIISFGQDRCSYRMKIPANYERICGETSDPDEREKLLIAANLPMLQPD